MHNRVNKLISISTSLNNLTAKLVDLDVKIKTAPINLKKFTDVVDNQVL